MRKLFFMAAMCIAMLSMQSAGVYAQDVNGKYKETLYKMMDKSGGLEAVKQMVPQLVGMMKQQAASQPDSFWEDFTKRWTKQFIDKMVERYAPIYQKYLTQGDLEAILAFYDTPVGQKMSAATPPITKEGMQMGQQLGMEIGQQMQSEIANMVSK
ncbi:DUF2059 domain-containing protein [Bacteroides helcogenes]|uniref:DUF2059 domain-containing protein n=1 Tax=Bacteroides helcogenes (strain ATCC 35417 / DSM 20613 / JCM 6297 / CCUG 15421 / P 36-108) TaxID=693979 RepID=E6SP01_BACT6|nr:DUF2059 domain-containing protein [Bacteroides helcogenes]ADV42819.1 Protein of unknown function DUF2059 [Bacteroides helcogenes P 36-108]MDY5239649.1 DUF2059 domain-containing protein [Bacteroides helcogenes]